MYKMKDIIESYDTDEIDKYIWSVRHEIADLKKTTESLQDKESEENIQTVENFMRIYETTILQQTEDMETLSFELKELVVTNEYLEGKEEEYKDLLASERFNNLIDKVRKIKKVKEELHAFLEQRGIPPPSS
jgi:hypothetical protein